MDGRFGSFPTNAHLSMQCSGGVYWNCHFDGDDGNPGLVANAPIHMDQGRAWTTASTMGMDDSAGTVNLYVEACTFKDVDTFIDCDRAGRVVVRNCICDGSWLLTHGFTSGAYLGGRHVELYDNEFKSTRTDEAKNMANRYFWLRAGTCVITDNSAVPPVRTQDYGSTLAILNIGDNSAPAGSQDMQPGWGHNGSADIREPIYVWDNTGSMGSTVTFNNQSGNWQAATTVATSAGDSGAELFIDLGAKPGWSKFTYPHPFRDEI
jgi:hypothetical protein